MGQEMYAAYLKEREDIEVYERPEGFMLLKCLPEGLYIRDIYVQPEHRKSGIGKQMLAEVEVIARDAGYKQVFGSVSPGAAGSTASLKVLLAVGFELKSCERDIIYFKKDL